MNMKVLRKLLSNSVDSITNKCCAPSTKDLFDADVHDMKLEDMARQTMIDEYGYDSINPTKSKRDLLIITTYFDKLNPNKIGIASIIRLCFNYYFIDDEVNKRFIYLVAERSDNINEDSYDYPSLDYSKDEDDSDEKTQKDIVRGGLYLSQIKNRQVNIHCDVYELNESDKLSILTNEWIVKFSAICSAKNIILPPPIYKKVVDEYKCKSSKMGTMREYNVIFKLCGSHVNGWSDLCNAVIIDETNLNEHEDCIAFNWHLPSLPLKTGGNGVVFDQKYGLISMGGYKSNKCFHLSFDDHAYFDQNGDEWIWHKLPSMNEHRWFPSCCMMNDRLISMNGSSNDHEPLRSMECFDFEQNEWQKLSSCNAARKYGGLYFEECDGLYLGGGDHASQSVEYYDLHKNEWFNLPNTQLPHKYCPNLWIDKEQNGNEILFIHCSYSSNFIEFIDLRSTTEKWNLMSANCDISSFGLDHNQIRSIL